MQVVRHGDAHEYWDRVRPFLMRKEAENCLAIGIARALISRVPPYPTYYLFSLRDGSETVGAGWMTPPHPICLTAVPEQAIPLLVEHARALGAPVPGVVGPKATAIAFKDAWLKAQGGCVASEIAERIFELTAVVSPAEVEGTFRQATEADRALLEVWHHAFIVDCKLPGDRRIATQACELGLKQGSRYVWQVGSEPVAMVGFGGETPSGIRVNWVYTPPGHRRRGYASALVAAMSQRLLDDGRTSCFLYTDLANPISNSIYQKLGYRPVCDAMHFTFAS